MIPMMATFRHQDHLTSEDVMIRKIVISPHSGRQPLKADDKNMMTIFPRREHQIQEKVVEKLHHHHQMTDHQKVEDHQYYTPDSDHPRKCHLQVAIQ